MKQSWKISINVVLSGEPILLSRGLRVFQPTIRDMVFLGSDKFGSICSIWSLTRKELLKEETNETWNLDDWEVYKKFLFYDLGLQGVFKDSVLFFFHKNVEFLKMQGSIFIGELESGVELTQELFSEIQGVIEQVTSQKDENQEVKNAPRSKRAQEIHDKIVAGQQKIDEMKRAKGVDDLTSQIVGVVAHGYKYEDVYNMTLLQFYALLEKLVQIENYYISMLLSPYLSKQKGDKKHWL